MGIDPLPGPGRHDSRPHNSSFPETRPNPHRSRPSQYAGPIAVQPPPTSQTHGSAPPNRSPPESRLSETVTQRNATDTASVPQPPTENHGPAPRESIARANPPPQTAQGPFAMPEVGAGSSFAVVPARTP